MGELKSVDYQVIGRMKQKKLAKIGLSYLLGSNS
jgi:hypothetical protein